MVRDTPLSLDPLFNLPLVTPDPKPCSTPPAVFSPSTAQCSNRAVSRIRLKVPKNVDHFQLDSVPNLDSIGTILHSVVIALGCGLSLAIPRSTLLQIESPVAQ